MTFNVFRGMLNLAQSNSIQVQTRQAWHASAYRYDCTFFQLNLHVICQRTWSLTNPANRLMWMVRICGSCWYVTERSASVRCKHSEHRYLLSPLRNSTSSNDFTIQFSSTGHNNKNYRLWTHVCWRCHLQIQLNDPTPSDSSLYIWNWPLIDLHN